MQKIEIQGTYRSEKGKGPARRLRAQGSIPAVLYRKGSSVSLAVNAKAVDRLLRVGSSRNYLITLSLSAEGQETRLAVIKEMQRHPLTGYVEHVDFLEVAMDEPIRVRVPVEIVGIATGVKAGGILQYSLREVDIQCFPEIVPDTLRVDVSSLEINQVIRVREVLVAEGIKFVTPQDRVVVSVVPPLSEAKMETLLTTGPKETKEPEVVGRKEKEVEEDKKDAGKPKEKEAGKAKEGGKK